MRVAFDVPEPMARYVDLNDHAFLLRVQELMMFELVRRGKLSFGKAAEILGIGKIQFVTDLGQLGLPYFDQSAQEVWEDAETARGFSEAGA